MKQSTGYASAFLIAMATVIGLTLAVTSVIAHLILTQQLDMKSVEICIAILLFVAVLLGEIVLINIMKTAPIHTLILGLLVIALITIGGLAVDGAFHHVLMNLGAVTLASVTAFFISIKRKDRRFRKN